MDAPHRQGTDERVGCALKEEALFRQMADYLMDKPLS
jgi:hypothetical protein